MPKTASNYHITLFAKNRFRQVPFQVGCLTNCARKYLPHTPGTSWTVSTYCIKRTITTNKTQIFLVLTFSNSKYRVLRVSILFINETDQTNYHLPIKNCSATLSTRIWSRGTVQSFPKFAASFTVSISCKTQSSVFIGFLKINF